MNLCSALETQRNDFLCCKWLSLEIESGLLDHTFSNNLVCLLVRNPLNCQKSLLGRERHCLDCMQTKIRKLLDVILVNTRFLKLVDEQGTSNLELVVFFLLNLGCRGFGHWGCLSRFDSRISKPRTCRVPIITCPC